MLSPNQGIKANPYSNAEHEMNYKDLIASRACCEQGPTGRSRNCSLMTVLSIFPSEFSEIYTIVTGLLFIIIIANDQSNRYSN